MLKQGDPIRVQPYEPHTIWRTATVVESVDHRSYTVQLENGGVLRRNRRHMRRDQGTAPSVTARMIASVSHQIVSCHPFMVGASPDKYK
ncbi:hypothetical protein NQZ68_031478 [Dissostichus eleginoides]|nr:hypothetical protein NQZ68_031478 [Dissostichus eleginoides]